MLQQIIALLLAAFFIGRVIWQKRKKKISGNEMAFWLVFWLLAGAAILFIKRIDGLVRSIGFSGTGIDVLFYLAVFLLFYLVFKIRLKIEKIDRSISKLNREMTLRRKK